MTNKLRPVSEVAEEFGKQFDELGMKPPKNSMPGLERELLKDYMRKALTTDHTAIREAIESALEGEIEVLEQVLKKTKEYVAVGHKKVYEAVKITSEYRGKLEAYKEALATIHTLLEPKD